MESKKFEIEFDVRRGSFMVMVLNDKMYIFPGKC